MENKVVIIGNDHINTLGVIRAFGENDIKPYVFLISDKKRNAVVKSKYVEKYWICNDEIDALEKVIDVFKDEKNKVALIPTSDASSLCLDENYLRLKDKFYTPNINDTEKEIYKYMDKFVQQELIKDNFLKCIGSQIIELESFDNKFKVKFPIIIKPIISAEGNKEDIKICNDIKEFNESKKELLSLKYSKVLIQEFIKYDYECDIQGFSYRGSTVIPGIIEKIRIFPQKRGSTTFGYVVPNKKYEKTIDGISKIMSKLNYTGIFDIEVFVKDDIVYLNEINFRNSAISYAYGKSYIPYYWYLSCINDKIVLPPFINEKYTFIEDQADLHNVIDRNIKFKEYRRDRKNSKILLTKNKKDSKPSKIMFISKVKNNILK